MSPDQASARAALRRCEWPSIALAAAVYGCYLLLTWNFALLPWWIAAPLGALLLALHGSLQHETMHFHPTAWRRVNALIGTPPLALWLPYAIYRMSHQRHHRHRDVLTDPDGDPESLYLAPGTLARWPRPLRLLMAIHRTLAGRMLIGPLVALARFWGTEFRRLRRRHRRVLWLRHAAQAAIVLVWVVGICGIPLFFYLGLMVYPSISLGLVRSFVEHRAALDPRHRTAVVEAHPFWALLFLNNNLHVAHHLQPALPWYRLPAAWRELRPRRTLPPGLIFGGYGEVFRKHLFWPADAAEHPYAQKTAP